jgi:putative PIN family toxin of toxin-antitoxin system
MKVVLDTNILASGAISATGTLSTIVDAWRSGQFKVIVSVPILEELERTWQKPYFRRYLTTSLSCLSSIPSSSCSCLVNPGFVGIVLPLFARYPELFECT